MAIVIGGVAAGCAGKASPGEPPQLDVPYPVSLESSVRVDNVFVAPDYPDLQNTPSGVHLGIHYSPVVSYDADLPYVAMAAGTIAKIEPIVSAGTHNVNVQLAAGGDVLIVYQFETQSADAADRDAQLAKLAVSEGDHVAAGDPIGDLHDAGAPEPLMHIGVIQGPDLVCPLPLFSEDAAARTQALIDRDNPTWQICYE